MARVFAAGAGWSAERRERLSEVIIRHMWPEVRRVDGPRGAICWPGATATEIIGRNADDFTPGFRSEVLERYPRLDLTEEFLASFHAQAGRKPNSSAAGAVRSGLSTRMEANPLDSPSQ